MTLVTPSPGLLQPLPQRELDDGEGDLPEDGGEVAAVEAPVALVPEGVPADLEAGGRLPCLASLLDDFHGDADQTRRRLA